MKPSTLLLLLSTTVLVALTSQARVQAQADLVPIDVSVPFSPIPVVADGTVQVVYELHITNLGPDELELTRIEVLGDDASGAPLASFAGADLTDRLVHYGSDALKTGGVVGAGQRVVMFLHLTLATADEVPHTLHHHLVVANESQEQATVVGVPVAVQQRTPLVIGAPLAGEGWLVVDDGMTDASDHRHALMTVDGRASIAQRFAEDWILIGEDGQVAHDDPAVNANWYGYGAEVLAVADALVVAVTDGIAENVPLSGEMAVPILQGTAGGNSVVLDLGDGYLAYYAHLQPASLRVAVGDSVKRGQVLALLGNSGNSDAPHLHFHIAYGGSSLGGEGVPYVFASFDVQGSVASLDVFETSEGWRIPQTLRADQRRLELPVANMVIRFP